MNKMVMQAVIAALVLMVVGWLWMGNEESSVSSMLPEEMLAPVDVTINPPVEEIEVIYDEEDAINVTIQPMIYDNSEERAQ